MQDRLARTEGKVTMLMGLVTITEGEATMLKGSLAEVEDEVTRLRGSLAQADERVSYSESRSLEVVAEAMEAFQKGEDFCQELLESYQDAYAKGARWCKRKVVKRYLSLDLDVLSLGMSSFGNDSDSSRVYEGSKATSPCF